MRSYGNLFKSSLTAFAFLILLPLLAQGQVTSRYNNTTTLLPNGNILIVGGQTTGGTVITTPLDVEVYISTTSSYVIGPSMGAGIERSSHTATLLQNGNVLVLGGISAAGVPRSDGVVFNPSNNTWTTVPGAMSTARYLHTITPLGNGRILITGGQVDLAGTVTNTCDIYTPTPFPGTFSACNSMNTPRAAHTATLLFNGNVYVAGGLTGSNAMTNTAEIYDPVTGIWTPSLAQITGRAFHTATAMGNRNVLITGGLNNAINFKENRGFLDVAEIYNPVSDTMEPPPPPMNARRMFHTSTLNPDGTVALYGGLGNITTTYFPAADIPFISVSTMGLTPITASTATMMLSSFLQLEIKGTLSKPVTGDIVKGQIYFSNNCAAQPSISLQDAKICFSANSNVPPPEYPVDNQFVKLDGTLVGCDPPDYITCGKLDRVLTLQPPSGTVNFLPQTLTSKDGVTTAGSTVNIIGGACADGTSCNFSGGTVNMPIDIPFPNTDIGATVLQATATILGGNMIIGQNTPVALSFASGGATFSGGQITADSTGAGHLTGAMTFFNVGGIASNNSGGAIGPAYNIANQKLTGLKIYIQYIVSPLNLTGINFHFDIATVTIRSMVFGDQENYNPASKDASKSWSFTPLRNQPSFHHSTVLLPDGDAFNFGGQRCDVFGVCSTFRALTGSGYIPQPTVFSADSSLANSRGNHTSTLLSDGRILVAGGTNGPSVLNLAEIYDPNTKTWSPTGAMNVPRAGHTATLLPNGRVLVAGGYISNYSSATTNTAEIYYPDSGQWVPTSVMISSRQAHTTVLLPNGDVLVAGGFGNGTYLNTAEVYVTTSAVWMPTSNLMTSPRSDHTGTLLQDGRVLVIGGINSIGVTKTAEAYNPNTNSWSAVSAMNSAGRGSAGRFAHTATLLLDGTVFVAGGDDGLGEILAPLLYSPATDSWSSFPITVLPGKTDQSQGRLRHTAVLLPNGRVWLIGGVTASNSSLASMEVFDIHDTWQTGLKAMKTARGFHTSVLLANGNVLVIGGASAPGSYLNSAEAQYFGGFPDAVGPSPSLRQPTISSMDMPLFDRGNTVSINGGNFKGMTEASGGGEGPSNSSYAHPRVYFQALNAPSGFLADLSPSVYTSPPTNLWSNIDSSITIPVPQLPYGRYHVRVANNAQFSSGFSAQAGPPLPTGTPGVPSGIMTSPASIAWTWTPAPVSGGSIDGYNIYLAGNNVFISTLSPTCGGGICQFVETGLKPNMTIAIKVAPYNISGDGPAALSTMTFSTVSAVINTVLGVGVDTGTIRWSWTNVPSAVSYKVFNTTSGTQIATVAGPTFVQVGLATNTVHSIEVIPTTSIGDGPISSGATVYTLAMPPAPPFITSPITNLSTSGFTVQWSANTNPAGTLYNLHISTDLAGARVISNIFGTAVTFNFSGGTPNSPYTTLAAAVNGDGILTSYTLLATTYTFAAVPSSVTILGTTPSSISLSWLPNGNPAYTLYQITISSDNFLTTVSTPIPFAAAFTGLSTTIPGLITGTNYTIRIVAMNQLGIITAPATINAVTFNGGGPNGTVSAYVDPSQTVNLSGTLQSGRTVSLTVYPGSFSQAVTISISSATAIPLCANPAALDDAISVTVVPALEPRLPLQLGISFSPSDPGITPVNTLSIFRYDLPNNTCAPLASKLDATQTLLFAQTNHLTTFQIAQLSPQAALDGTRIFPNPLYTNTQGYITFDRMPAASHVRIYTLHGEEVFDGTANASGVLIWPAQNKSQRPVGSGLYVAVIDAGGQTLTRKLVIIR